MTKLRTISANLFVCWPLCCLLWCLGRIRVPILWCTGRVSNRLDHKIRDLYATVGLRIYWLMVLAREGKEAANLALLQLLIEAMLEQDGEQAR